MFSRELFQLFSPWLWLTNICLKCVWRPSPPRSRHKHITAAQHLKTASCFTPSQLAIRSAFLSGLREKLEPVNCIVHSKWGRIDREEKNSINCIRGEKASWNSQVQSWKFTSWLMISDLIPLTASWIFEIKYFYVSKSFSSFTNIL